MGKPVHTQKIDTVFVLIIFCIFAASVLISLIFGGNIYKNTTDKSNEKYDENICLSYIWVKTKNIDTGGAYVDDFQGRSVLCLEEEYDGIEYLTMIYQENGWVCELFAEKALEFSPQDGTPVIKADSLVFEEVYKGLIKATVGTESILISPRSKSGISYNNY